MNYHLTITVSEKDGTNERSYTASGSFLKDEIERDGFILMAALKASSSCYIDEISKKIVKDSKKAIEIFDKNIVISELTTPDKPLSEAQL